MAYERFIDRPDNRRIIRDCLDFTLRKYGLPPRWVFYFFGVAILTTIIAIHMLSVDVMILEKDEPFPVQKVFFTLIVSGLLISGTGIFAYAMVHKFRDILVQTEFQNMLYSSSMSIDTEFVVISNREKEILHYDYHFDHVFIADSNQRASFSMLETSDGFTEKDRKAFTKAVEENKHAEIPFTLKAIGKKAKDRKLNVVVEPLSRPGGYCVIRAYNQ